MANHIIGIVVAFFIGYCYCAYNVEQALLYGKLECKPYIEDKRKYIEV